MREIREGARGLGLSQTLWELFLCLSTLLRTCRPLLILSSTAKLNREPKQKWLREQTRSRRRDRDDDKGDLKSVTAFLTIDHLDEVRSMF